MGNSSYKQGFLAHWLLCRLLGQNQPTNAEIVFQYSSASWSHHYACNSFLLLGLLSREKTKILNWIHLRNINLIKRMTRGDKGRRVFITRINFYLHCTDTPVPMYWCVLVGKTCAVLCRTPAPKVPVRAEQRRQKSHSELQEREQMVQTFTHTYIHTFSWHKVTSMLKRIMAGVSHSGFSTKIAWERTAAGEELWWNRGWAMYKLSLHKLRLTSASLQFTEHFHAHLQSPYRPHGAGGTSMAPHTQTTAQHPQMLYLRTCMETVL